MYWLDALAVPPVRALSLGPAGQALLRV